AMSEVLAEMPGEMRGAVQEVTASSQSDGTLEIALECGGAKTVVWGDAQDAELKAEVVQALLGRPGGVIDVSSPVAPVTRCAPRARRRAPHGDLARGRTPTRALGVCVQVQSSLASRERRGAPKSEPQVEVEGFGSPRPGATQAPLPGGTTRARTQTWPEPRSHSQSSRSSASAAEVSTLSTA